MRSRNLKPAIFKNEELAKLGPWHVILFEGLWCIADRMGRLEDRPERIEAEVFPFKFQKVNINRLLDALAGGEEPFIIRYEVDGDRFIQVVNFSAHQNPHPREADSSIPPSKKKAMPRHGLGKSKDMPSRADVLIPSSLNPDVLNPSMAAVPPAVAPEPPYKRPDPKTEPLRALVWAYKIKKGFPAEDRAWDRQEWPRCSKAGKLILEAFDGHLRPAVLCLEGLADDFEKKGLDWTLETILKRCLEWKLKHGGYGNGTTGGERVFNDFAKPQRARKSERVGSFFSAGASPSSVGTVPDISSRNRGEEGIPASSDGSPAADVEPAKLEGQPDR